LVRCASISLDPFAQIKRQVLARLHPRPSGTRPEVEQKVRQALQEVLTGGDMPVTAVDRARIAREIWEIIEA